jgi:quercetin dioxygenase-like cupin family protein
MTTTTLLDGWDINAARDIEWVPWGATGDARAKVLGMGDGYVVALVDADAGYAGTPHEHTNTEFLYVLEGRLRNQGRFMDAGDAYVASIGSTHTDFEALIRSTYLSIFKI